TATSGNLVIDNRTAIKGDDYTLFGHNDAPPADLAIEPSLVAPPNTQRVGRQWRIMIYGDTVPETVDFTATDLPAIDPAYQKYVLLIYTLNDPPFDFSKAK